MAEEDDHNVVEFLRGANDDKPHIRVETVGESYLFLALYMNLICLTKQSFSLQHQTFDVGIAHRKEVEVEQTKTEELLASTEEEIHWQENHNRIH